LISWRAPFRGARQEINQLVGDAAEVRSQIHDDRIRCPVLPVRSKVRTRGRRHHGARVRRMRAHRVVPRRDRTMVLSGEPRSRSGSCVRLPDPCSQHGPAIRGAHVRARSTQPNVKASPLRLARIPSAEHAGGGFSSLSRGLDQGAARGEFGSRAPPRSRWLLGRSAGARREHGTVCPLHTG